MKIEINIPDKIYEELKKIENNITVEQHVEVCAITGFIHMKKLSDELLQILKGEKKE